MNKIILAAAEELVQRVGASATEWVEKRILMLQEGGNIRAADDAYQLLTAVEQLLAERVS